jgi:hypothetical protein
VIKEIAGSVFIFIRIKEVAKKLRVMSQLLHRATLLEIFCPTHSILIFLSILSFISKPNNFGFQSNQI